MFVHNVAKQQFAVLDGKGAGVEEGEVWEDVCLIFQKAFNNSNMAGTPPTRGTKNIAKKKKSKKDPEHFYLIGRELSGFFDV